MFRRARLCAGFAVLGVWVSAASACAAGNDEGTPPVGHDATTDGGSDTTSEPPVDASFDVGDGAACTGLQCQQVDCGGGTKTTVSGTVYDPAGTNPLYDIFVYVPNAALDPMKHGVGVCDQCGAVVSGSPVVTAVTDAAGKFTLENVPVGKDIPLVIQVGKWRRKFVLPNVAKCVDNPVPDPTNPDEKLRLPRNKTEGDMPLIAFSTGCDPMENLFRKIGIDLSEFTNGSGTGMLHVYQGTSGSKGLISDPTPAQAFWEDADKLKKYDIVVNACECKPYDRGAAYGPMRDYLNAGGRFFGSHFHYNWFAPPTGAKELQGSANWTPVYPAASTDLFTDTKVVDTTFPKGKAMADWLNNIKATPTYGEMKFESAAYDIGSTISGVSQRWIYGKGDNGQPAGKGRPAYISFNTPVGAAAETQCGRAVFADLHVSDVAVQEAALEFMFFDLSACVQKDTDPVKPPPIR
jgi:hypothetical protein